MRRIPALVVATVLCLTACQAQQTDPDLAGEEALPAPEPTGDEALPTAPPASDEDARPVVASTSAPVADLTRQVLGERGTLHLLPPLGDTDEDRRPDVADLVRVASADLFVANGLYVDDGWAEYAEVNLREDSILLRLADELVARDGQARQVSFSDDLDAFQPYLWRDITYAMDHVERIRDALVEVDPDGADTYRANAAAYLEQLAVLDRAVAEATATIPATDRQVLVHGFSWEPFGRRYGLTVVHAMPLGDPSDPSDAGIGRLVEQVRDLEVRVVFGNEALPPAAAARIAEESGAVYVGDLVDELHGQPGEEAHSFMGTMVHNARVLITNLGGDTAALDTVPLDVLALDGTARRGAAND